MANIDEQKLRPVPVHRVLLTSFCVVLGGCTGIIDGAPISKKDTGDVAAPGGLSEPTDPSECIESPSPRLLRQLTREEYQKTVADLLGIADPDISPIPPDATVRGFTNNVTVSFVTAAHLDAFFRVGDALATRALSESFDHVVPCTTQDAACAATFVESFGLRAFRRPLSEDEKARYLAFFAPSFSQGDFNAGVAGAIQAMLIAPTFLLRSELGLASVDGGFRLTPYETASALSYTFWGTMPDDALFESAASGALGSAAEVEAQARRLLADPRGRARVAHFFYEWLEVPKMYFATKDPATYPALFSGASDAPVLHDSMRAEQAAFVGHVVFDSTQRFAELFTANYTFANDALAAHYGLPAPGSPSEVTKVFWPPDSARSGLLTMGAFLFGHARTTSSSPTQRGHLIREALLCNDISPPPPGVDANIPAGSPGRTAREQIENLTASGACPACHQTMDPIGFGLEAFDGIGQFRTIDNGVPVDTTGEIVGLSAPATFDGAKELSTILANSREARACLVTNYYRFARGFDAKDSDACALSKLQHDFVEADVSIPDLFVALALQQSFGSRRSAEELVP